MAKVLEMTWTQMNKWKVVLPPNASEEDIARAAERAVSESCVFRSGADLNSIRFQVRDDV